MQATTTVQNSVSMVHSLSLSYLFNSLTRSIGCPVLYQPLSLHLPDHFNHLRSRQLLNAQHPSWWPALPSPPLNLQDEIMAAITEPLLLAPKPSLKNSISHPIKYAPNHFLLSNPHPYLAFPS